jgi:hypothetical protein
MLNDGSLLTLAPKTKLVISRSVYEPKKKSRSTYMQQDGGKVRYWIKKLLGHNPSEFKVKTPTAVAGVRGSDFIIDVTATRTEVTALGQTELEVVSLAAPHMNPTRVLDFERTIIESGALPSDVQRVAPEEIEQIKQDLPIGPGRMEPEAELNNDAGAAEAVVESSEAEDGVVTEEDGEEGLQAGVIIDYAAEAPLVLVPPTELVMPEALTDIPELEAQIPGEITEPGIIQGREQAVLDQQQAILEQVQEEIVELNRTLPDFPGTP